ncbi:MAG: DNA recombination/repair protein RecA [Acidobacteriia bacterium]|nr:DNA recombination/repair protein RecA [Terriglobia bacterium]
MTSGIPLSALTEICGSNLASSGKTSLLHSLLVHAAEKYFCALVDAGDSFDPASAESAGVNFSRLLWVRCGGSRQKLPPMEQAFKAADMLLQSGGFGLIVMDLSSIPEKVVRRVPLSSWFRFSRVLEKQSAALVVIGQRPHATSCAELVLQLKTRPAAWSGKLLTQFRVEAEVVRAREKRPVQFDHQDFHLKSQWA